MKHQASFSSKDKSKKLKCRLLQFLFGALRVKQMSPLILSNDTVLLFCFFTSTVNSYGHAGSVSWPNQSAASAGGLGIIRGKKQTNI